MNFHQQIRYTTVSDASSPYGLGAGLFEEDDRELYSWSYTLEDDDPWNINVLETLILIRLSQRS